MTAASKAIRQAKNKRWEDLMWFHLKTHGLQQHFAREQIYIPGRRFRLDMADLKNKIGIEIEGGIFMAKGAHNTGPAIQRDCEKNNLGIMNGWRVLKFTPDAVKDLSAINFMVDFYRQKIT